MVAEKHSKKVPPEFRNVVLSDALQTQDMAAVAFALRHGPTIVPLAPAGRQGDRLDLADVWTYRDPKTGDISLLLFSDLAHKPESLPPAVALQSPAGCAHCSGCTRRTSRWSSSTSPVRIRCRRLRAI